MNTVIGKYSSNLRMLVAVIMSVAVIAGCQKKNARQQGETEKSVMVETLKRMDVAEVLEYSVDLVPYIQVTVFSPIPDRLVYFPWHNGDEIRRGQRVALVRKEGLDKGLDQILAQIDALDVQLKNLKNELDRSKELLKAGVITQSTYDKIQTSYLSTMAQRRALEASKAQLEVRAGNAVITAPISGIIADKRLELGDMAVPQVPLCRIMQVDKLKVYLNLIERDVSKVKEGMQVDVVLDAYPDKVFKAQVTNIYPYMNMETRSNTVEAVIDNPRDEKSGARLLKPGMYGKAMITVSKRKNVLVVPEQALLLDDQLLRKQRKGERLRKVFVVQDDKAHARTVKLGMQSKDYVEVLDGLNDGEDVVIRGQHRLKDGQTVKVLNRSTEQQAAEGGSK